MAGGKGGIGFTILTCRGNAVIPQAGTLQTKSSSTQCYNGV